LNVPVEAVRWAKFLPPERTAHAAVPFPPVILTLYVTVVDVLETFVTVTFTLDLRAWHPDLEHAVALPGVATAVVAPARTSAASIETTTANIRVLFMYDLLGPPY
jgi:hypothetical protein